VCAEKERAPQVTLRPDAMQRILLNASFTFTAATQDFSNSGCADGPFVPLCSFAVFLLLAAGVPLLVPKVILFNYSS